MAEIERCNLSTVLLELVRLNVGSLHDLDLIQNPDETAVNVAVNQLRQLNAIEPADEENANFVLTELGTKLVDFPLDPKFAK